MPYKFHEFEERSREWDAHAKRFEIDLERRRFCRELAVSPRIRHDMQNEERHRLTLEVFCFNPHEYKVELPAFFVPATWWDAFKIRWFPGWARRRWPAKTRKLGGGALSFDVAAMFPEIDPLREQYRIEYHCQPKGGWR